jgi:hypothetical protein
MTAHRAIEIELPSLTAQQALSLLRLADFVYAQVWSAYGHHLAETLDLEQDISNTDDERPAEHTDVVGQSP